MAKLSLVFTELTQGEHDYLTNAYRIITGGGDGVALESGAPVERPANEYDAARQHVESRPQTAGVPQAAGPDLDAHGVPYNPAVHTSTKAKREDGVWSKKKGAGDAYDQWHAQYRRQPANAPAVAAPSPTSNGAGVPAIIPQPGPAYALPPAPAVATGPVLQQVDYGTWYGAYETAVATGRMNEGILTMINQQCGVPDASAYAHNDHARMVSYGMLQRLNTTGSI